MTKKRKLLPCVCGETPNGYGWARVHCTSCTREVSGVDKKDAAIMWNMLMTSITEAKNANID